MNKPYIRTIKLKSMKLNGYVKNSQDVKYNCSNCKNFVLDRNYCESFEVKIDKPKQTVCNIHINNI